MEAEKINEKAKRGECNDYFMLSTPMILTFLSIAFALLTIFTSYQSFAVLPQPLFFYEGSIAFGMMLTGIAFLIGLSTVVRKTYLGVLSFMIFACGIINLPALGGIGGIGTWVFAVFPYYAFRWIPPVLFPLLFLLSLILVASANYSQTLNHSLPVRIISILLIAIIGLYLWGHAINFETDFYDEGLEIEGITYHSIINYGWLGDPNTFYLYECQLGYFFCERIYDSSNKPDYHYDDSIFLVYEQAAKILRFEYHSEESALILYEHPIP